jgi:hypothetical protein
MHRIDGADTEPNAHGPGKAGFHKGDPHSGREATEITEDFMNAVQEELCCVIESAGLTLDKNNHQQLALACSKIMLEAVPAWDKIRDTPNSLDGYGIRDAAPLHSPQLTGTPSAPTPAPTDSSQRLATTAFVQHTVDTIHREQQRRITDRVAKTGDSMTGDLELPSLRANHGVHASTLRAGSLLFFGNNTSSNDWHIGKHDGLSFYQGVDGQGECRVKIDLDGRVTMPAQPHWYGCFGTINLHHDAALQAESLLGSGWVVNNHGYGGGTRIYPPANAWYEVSCGAHVGMHSNGGQCQLFLFKNDVPTSSGISANRTGTSVPLLIFLTTSDFISLRCVHGHTHGDPRFNKILIQLRK